MVDEFVPLQWRLLLIQVQDQPLGQLLGYGWLRPGVCGPGEKPKHDSESQCDLHRYTAAERRVRRG